MPKIKSHKIYSIVLAAGKGKRMNTDLPKVLHQICNKPMLAYILATLKKLNFPTVIVVGYRKDRVKKYFGNQYTYAEQKSQLGTGHAVLSAKTKIPQNIETILVLNGDDSAFYQPQTLKNLLDQHLKHKNAITFLSLRLKDPSGFGRIKRDQQNKILSIIEEKNASQEEKKISEINLGTYCFASDFLWKNLPKIAKNRISGEYYLTDLLALAIKNRAKIQAILLPNSREWHGVNTKEQLKAANLKMQQCLNTKKSPA